MAGLTIDRIYTLLEGCADEQFLICLLSLLRNFFDEKDTETLLAMFNEEKLLGVSSSSKAWSHGYRRYSFLRYCIG